MDTSPALDEAGHLYVASYKDGVFALDANTGDVIWHTATAGVTQSLLAGGTLFATGDRQLQALTTASGRSLWAVTLKGKSAHQPVLVRDMLVVPLNDVLVFVDPLTGKEKVGWDPGQGVSATPVWTGTRLYVLSNLGFLYAMRLAGGRRG